MERYPSDVLKKKRLRQEMKLVLNKLKVMGGPTLIYTPLGT